MNEPIVYNEYGIIYFPKKKIPRKYFVLKKIGVKKNTFAGNTISRMYDYYFKDAINFKKEYKKYYRKEFASVIIFIEEHFNMDHDRAVKLANGNYSIKYCTSQSIERNIETLNYDEKLKKSFSDAIGGIADEDPDGIYYE